MLLKSWKVALIVFKHKLHFCAGYGWRSGGWILIGHIAYSLEAYGVAGAFEVSQRFAYSDSANIGHTAFHTVLGASDCP